MLYTQYNLSFFKPKKGNVYCVLKKLNLLKKIRGIFHTKRKADANRVKELNKQRAIHDETFVSASFNLQSVLQIPYSEYRLFTIVESYMHST